MRNVRILIVEDEYVIAESLQAKLERQGYTVCGSEASGERAIQKAGDEMPDMVLMDIMLKGDMDGIEAAEQIRARFGIPIIYLTAFSDGNILERAKVTEPFGYLLKPFEDRELFANIEMTLYKAKMEEELLRAKKLESVGILAGGIAHDYNNLLTVILGYISMVKEMALKSDDFFNYLTEAEKASLRAKDLTHRLITLSKGGAPVKKTGSIVKLIKESAKLALTGSNVACEFHIPDDLWSVSFDDAQMRHVINSIIMNADQAMAEGGMIKIRAENFHLDAEKGTDVFSLQDGKYVKISVEDRGIGISKENLSLIFDPYFSTRERGGQRGMGLGLAVAYSVVRQHEGHITAESEIGVGTTFHIYLPALEKKVIKEKAVRKTPGPVVGKKKILVMDDEKIVRDFLKKVLSRMGWEVECAREGDEAISLYRKVKESDAPFDVVILDLTVQGGMGGKETLPHLKEIDPDVRAIISSGYSDDPVMANFKEYGFRGAVPKPSTLKELNDTLCNVLMND